MGIVPCFPNMRQSDIKLQAGNALIFIFLVLVLTFTIWLGNIDLTRMETLGFWPFVYLAGFLLIVFLVLKGEIYHPVVLVGSSYVFLLVIGTFVFEEFRGRPLSPYVHNLIGIGFLALLSSLSMVIILTGGKKHPQKYQLQHVQLVYGLAILGILSALIMFAKFKGIPLLAANPNEAKVNFLAGNGIFNLFFKGMPVFAMAILYIRVQLGQSLLIAHMYCGLMMILILLAGYRSTTLISLGEYVFLYLIIKEKKVPTYAWVVAFILAIFYMTFLGSYRRGNAGLAGATEELDIILNTRPVWVEIIIRNFTEFDYYHGSLYYNDFKRFLPGTQVNANVDLKYALFANADDMPENTGITPSIVGEAYMNFGQDGVLWVSIVVGIIIGLFYWQFLQQQNFLWMALFLTLVFGMAGGIQSGIGLKLIHLTQFWFWVIFIGLLMEKKENKTSYS